MSRDGVVERVWYGTDSLASLSRSALAPLEWAYAASIGARDVLYDAGLLPTRATSIPAVSVGNLTVGGTGKTPVAAWIAQLLAARGAHPAIVLRGYGDDEPKVHEILNPSVPVVTDADRVRGTLAARARGANVAVLDDAFQHRGARRALDLVLVSADRWTKRRRLLPAGPWREPLHAAKRASFVIVTRKAATESAVDRVYVALSEAAPRVRRLSVAIALGELRRVGSAEVLPLTALAGTVVRVMAGIADPRSFVHQLEAAGAIVQATVFPDHHHFSNLEIRQFAQSVPPSALAVCTLKDAVKLASRWPREAPPIWYVSQHVTVERGSGGLEHALDEVLAHDPAHASP